MGILKVFGRILAFLAVLALFLGVFLFVITVAWMARLVLLLIFIVMVIMYALKEACSGLFKKRRSP